MILATFATGSFDFAVLGHTKDECRSRLAGAWAIHAAQTGADRDYFREYAGDVNYAPITPGVVLRDGSPIIAPAVAA